MNATPAYTTTKAYTAQQANENVTNAAQQQNAMIKAYAGGNCHDNNVHYQLGGDQPVVQVSPYNSQTSGTTATLTALNNQTAANAQGDNVSKGGKRKLKRKRRTRKKSYIRGRTKSRSIRRRRTKRRKHKRKH